MSASLPARLVRQTSVSSTRYASPAQVCNHPEVPLTSLYSSADNSSHDHIFQNHSSHNTHHLHFTSWLRESWAPLFHRHEQIAVGALPRGIALMTREMMEMQVQQAPNIRGMLDCLPTRLPARHATLQQETFFRQKLGTWPLSKHEAMVARQFESWRYRFGASWLFVAKVHENYAYALHEEMPGFEFGRHKFLERARHIIYTFIHLLGVLSWRKWWRCLHRYGRKATAVLHLNLHLSLRSHYGVAAIWVWICHQIIEAKTCKVTATATS